MTNLLDIATITAAVGAGVSGGALFAFSSFVMPALSRLPDAVGMRAMQAINAAAPTPSFMAVLFGTGALAAIVAVVGTSRGESRLLIPAAVLYGVALVVTVAYHVPRNDALAALDATSAAGAAAWHTYLVEWTRMNHVRAAAAVIASGLFAAAAR